MKHVRHFAPALLACVLTSLPAACSSDEGNARGTPHTTGPPSSAAQPLMERECANKSRHVLVVGIDGLRADSIEPADAPSMDRLYETGTSTLHGYAGGEPGTPTEQPTLSGPGWATILTGTWANRHHVLDNEFTQWKLAQPNFLKRIGDHDPSLRLAAVQQWIPVRTLVGGAADLDEIGVGDQVERFAVEEIQNQDPTVVFLHFDDVDHAGHATGYGPDRPEYLTAIATVDDHITAILRGIEDRPGRSDECWATVVTTDHGGTGTGHGGQTAEERTIPLIVSGDGIEAKEVDSGPGHDAVAPTVLTYLGVPIDDSWDWTEPFGVSSE